MAVFASIVVVVEVGSFVMGTVVVTGAVVVVVAAVVTGAAAVEEAPVRPATARRDERQAGGDEEEARRGHGYTDSRSRGCTRTGASPQRPPNVGLAMGKPTARVWFGVIIAAAGATLLFLGWYGVSGESSVAEQVPYLASATIPGAALLIVGAMFAIRERHSARAPSGW